MLVRDLPEDLRAAIDGRDLIVFDGVCVLCAGFFHFVLRWDRHERFRFATAQGPVGQALYRALDLPTDVFETNLVITDGRIHQRLDAFAAVMTALGGAWQGLGCLRYLPHWLKDPAYRAVAHNRYRLFGRRSQCLFPGPDLRARFLGPAT